MIVDAVRLIARRRAQRSLALEDVFATRAVREPLMRLAMTGSQRRREHLIIQSA
jgi:hypothetical protein